MTNKIILIIAIFFIPVYAFSQEQIGIEDAVIFAKENNANISRSKIALDAALRNLNSSIRVYIPKASIGTEVSTSSAYLNAQASISLSADTFFNSTQNKLSYEQALLSYEQTISSVELSVRKSYYCILLAKEKITLIENNIASATNNYKQSLIKQKAGLSPELDTLTAKVNLELLKPSLENAKLDYENQITNFKNIIGLDKNAEIILIDNIEQNFTDYNIPNEKEIQSGIENSYSVSSLKNNLEIAKTTLKENELSLYFPTLSFSASYRPNYNNLLSSDSVSISASANFSIDNLMPYSSAKQTMLKSEDNVKTIESQLNEELLNEEIAIETLKRNIIHSISQIEVLNLSQELSQKTYELTFDSYKNGIKDYTSLQNALNNLNESKIATLEEKYNLISRVLELEYELNIPFGSLKQIIDK